MGLTEFLAYLHGMKKYMSVLLFCGLLSFSFGQSLEKVDITFGGAVGTESILVFPKVGWNYSYLNLDNFNSSAGMEVGVWALLFFHYSVNVYNSFEFKLVRDQNSTKLSPYLILDNSFGFYKFPDPYGGRKAVDPYIHYTYTPKIGLSYGVLYMKLGHSFFLSDNYRDAQNLSDPYVYEKYKPWNPAFEAGLRFRLW